MRCGGTGLSLISVVEGESLCVQSQPASAWSTWWVPGQPGYRNSVSKPNKQKTYIYHLSTEIMNVRSGENWGKLLAQFRGNEKNNIPVLLPPWFSSCDVEACMRQSPRDWAETPNKEQPLEAAFCEKSKFKYHLNADLNIITTWEKGGQIPWKLPGASAMPL